ncbi:hypothetical protein ACFWYW_58975 [Nonomuraea sp. NPDC059023]|uniref:hypothetical protein n=1 Tax=unclassified Nonomuraea TaxID=2593643 RepID=UPI0036AF07EC
MGEIRRFRLRRVEDVSGVSGTGIVAEGVAFSDGWTVLQRLGREPMNEPTIVTWLNNGHEGVVKVHGHNGSTRVEWIDIPNPIPEPDYASAWTELRGYVEHAVQDGSGIDADSMLAYLDDLKRRALAPGRDWIAKLIQQPGDAS